MQWCVSAVVVAWSTLTPAQHSRRTLSKVFVKKEKEKEKEDVMETCNKDAAPPLSGSHESDSSAKIQVRPDKRPPHTSQLNLEPEKQNTGGPIT
jgi:hypothetical protein